MNGDKNYYMEQPVGVMGVAPTANPAYILNGYSPLRNTPSIANVGQYFNNTSSKYDEELGDIEEFTSQGRTVDDVRAEKQSGWDMIGNALVNNLVIAGTTAVSGTIGIVDGILEALTSQDASKLWDNSVNNWAVDVQDASREAMPIYRGKEYTDSSIWDKMETGIFWADLFENLGYTEGMLIPGMGAASLMSKLPSAIRGVAGSAVSAIGEASTEAVSARNDEVMNKEDIARQVYSEKANTISDLDNLYRLEEEYQNTLQDIQEDANNAGNFTFGANIALLTLTNTIEFGDLLSRGFSTSRRTAGALHREGMLYSAESTGTAIGKTVGKKVIDAFSEGMEEVSQSAISNTAQYYTDYNKFNESEFNPEKRELVSNLISALGESYAKTLQDPQTQEEFASGFITGLIGAPQLRKAKIPVKIENNIIGEVYDIYKQNKREQQLAESINNRLADDKQFNAYYNGLVRHLVMQDDINTALDDADHTAFANATSAKLISDIMMFSEAGHLDHLKELVNNSIDLSDEGIENIVQATTKEGEGPFVSNGNRMNNEDIRRILQEKQNYINHKIDFISKNKNVLQANYPALNDEGINNVLFLKSQLDDHTDRYSNLLEEVRGSILKLVNSISKDFEIRKSVASIASTTENLSRHLNDPNFASQVQELINDNTSNIPYDDRRNISVQISDVNRLQRGIIDLNIALADALSNPKKTNSSKQKAAENMKAKNEAKKATTMRDKVNNANVSDIVKGIESGDLEQNQLDGLFTSEDNDFLNSIGQEEKRESSTGKQKVQEAKNIIQTKMRMDGIIDTLEDTSIDPQAVEDAHKLLSNSKEMSESEQEILDTATQAYNDPNILYDEDDPSLQGLTQEEIESVLNERIDAAKSIIEQAKAILKEQNDELHDLPNEDMTVIKSLELEDTAKDKNKSDILQAKETGHDATSIIPTENERQNKITEEEIRKQEEKGKQAQTNSLFNYLIDTLPFPTAIPLTDIESVRKDTNDLLNEVTKLLNENLSPEEISKIIKNTKSYQSVKEIIGPTFDNFLNEFVKNEIEYRKKGAKKEEEEVQKQEENSETNVNEGSEEITPVLTEAEVRNSTTAQMSVDPNQETPTEIHLYWKPTLSYLPFGKAYKKGNLTPFYKIARELKKASGEPMYTEAQLRRIEAVGKYLDDHGAFKLVDSGAVKAGDEVHFFIDGSLNDAAGEIVILMTDSQGRVIGDVMSPTDSRFASQLGLPQFIDRVTKEYQDSGFPQYFTSKETTIVDKNMVGKIPYLADHQTMNTLNEVHSDGERPIPFKIGVSVNSGQNARILATAGRTKRQGQSEEERTIVPPLTAKAGQPFLLFPTSSKKNHYIPVPILMEPYSDSTKNSALGRAIHKVLERIPASDNSNAMSIINALEELISVQEIHINYDGDNVKVTIKPNGAEHQMSIYNGTKSAPNIVEQLELGLQGQPFQISRKYMNEDYEGQDYNRMIGEVARVNLPIGATHTISDWFTINPIGADGKPMKAKSPRSTGQNPHAAEVPIIAITYGNMQLTVDTKNWIVSDGKQTYNGPKADLVKARAFGIYTNQNMEKPYDTKWGYYDPKTNSFVEKPAKVLRTLEVSTAEESLSPSTAKQATLTNSKSGKSYTIKVGETRRIDDGMYPGVSTIIDIKDDGTIVDSYYDETIEETTTREFSSEGYLTELSYGTLVTLDTKIKTDTPAQLEEKAKRAGLLGNKVRQALWQVLSSQQQSLIANKKGPKQVQWMEVLEGAFNVQTNTFDEIKLKGSVDDFLGRKGMYRRIDKSQRVWDRQKELTWMKRVLPNLSDEEHLRIREGVDKLATHDGGYAYGKFQNGIITLAGNTVRGTLYHEAFHAVTHTLLNPQEYKELFDAAKEKWGNIGNLALEESLAEDFRRYVQFEEIPILGKVIKIYRTLKHLVQNLFGKEPYINRLYYSINRGKFANRRVEQSRATRYSTISRLDNINYQIEAKENKLKEVNSQWDKVTKVKPIKWFTSYEGNNVVRYKHYSTIRYSSRPEAESHIPQNLKDVLIVREDEGRHFILIDRKENVESKKEALKSEINSLKEQKTLLEKRNREEEMERASDELLQNNEVYYRKVEQYYADKFMYNNLSKEDKDYLIEKNITLTEYNQMTKFEKEVLFHCKY